MLDSTLDCDSLTDKEETSDHKSANNQEVPAGSRRYMDAINSLGPAIDVDRRDSRRERRFGKLDNYQGPARRKINDRRKNPRDRRK